MVRNRWGVKIMRHLGNPFRAECELLIWHRIEKCIWKLFSRHFVFLALSVNFLDWRSKGIALRVNPKNNQKKNKKRVNTIQIALLKHFKLPIVLFSFLKICHFIIAEKKCWVLLENIFQNWTKCVSQNAFHKMCFTECV